MPAAIHTLQRNVPRMPEHKDDDNDDDKMMSKRYLITLRSDFRKCVSHCVLISMARYANPSFVRYNPLTIKYNSRIMETIWPLHINRMLS